MNKYRSNVNTGQVHSSTGNAFTRINRICQRVSHSTESGYKQGGEAMPVNSDGSACFEAITDSGEFSRGSFESIIDNGPNLYQYTSDFLDNFPTRQRSTLAPYVVALIDSIDEQGFLSESVRNIAQEYSLVFFEQLGSKLELQPKKLENTRLYLRDHGTYIGMMSLNTFEYKWCLARHMTGQGFSKNEAVAPAKILGHTREFTQLSKKLEFDLLTNLAFLSEKLMVIASEKESRRLTHGMVKKFVKCDKNIAGVLADIYNWLPASPKNV